MGEHSLSHFAVAPGVVLDVHPEGRLASAFALAGAAVQLQPMLLPQLRHL
jgi:hypothetical protein